jgi:hypothetical protein
MKPEYYHIYEDMLYAYYGSSWTRAFPFRLLRLPPTDQSLKSIEKAVKEACDARRVELRPDAKFFLIVNFHQMVVLPLEHTHDRYAQGEILETIRADIDLIIAVAAEAPKDEGQISGGAILRTTAQLWEKLKINAQNIWT